MLFHVEADLSARLAVTPFFNKKTCHREERSDVAISYHLHNCQTFHPFFPSFSLPTILHSRFLLVTPQPPGEGGSIFKKSSLGDFVVGGYQQHSTKSLRAFMPFFLLFSLVRARLSRRNRDASCPLRLIKVLLLRFCFYLPCLRRDVALQRLILLLSDVLFFHCTIYSYINPSV